MLSKISIAPSFKSYDFYDNKINTYSIKPGMVGGCQELDLWNTTHHWKTGNNRRWEDCMEQLSSLLSLIMKNILFFYHVVKLEL